MHAGIAVAIGDIKIPVARVDGHVGAPVKRFTTHEWRRLAAQPQREEHLALQGTLAHGVITVVRTEERPIGACSDAMGAREEAFPPRPQEVALAVEHHHRMRPTVKSVDIVIGVDPNRGDFLEPPAIGELRPVFHHFVGIVACA